MIKEVLIIYVPQASDSVPFGCDVECRRLLSCKGFSFLTVIFKNFIQ